MVVGPNFVTLADSVAAGHIRDAQIALAISNREGAPGLALAQQRGLPTKVIPSKGIERETYDRTVVAALAEAERGSCLPCRIHAPAPPAYFVSRVSPAHPLNIHPSLLPAFPGLEAQRQALEYGVEVQAAAHGALREWGSRCRLRHVLQQAIVPIEPGDTPSGLSQPAFLAEEHRIYHPQGRPVGALRAVPCRGPARLARPSG